MQRSENNPMRPVAPQSLTSSIKVPLVSFLHLSYCHPSANHQCLFLGSLSLPSQCLLLGSPFTLVCSHQTSRSSQNGLPNKKPSMLNMKSDFDMHVMTALQTPCLLASWLARVSTPPSVPRTGLVDTWLVPKYY